MLSNFCGDECGFCVLRSFRHTHAALAVPALPLLTGRLSPGALSFQASLLEVALAESGSIFGEPQVMELATQGAAAVAVWMKQQLLEHVQKLAVCRDVAT